MQPLLEVSDLEVRRRGGFAVQLASLRLHAGQVAALYGPSGCGKTTVMRAMLGLGDAAAEVAGQVRLLGADLNSASASERRHRLRHEVMLLAQDAHAALDPLQPVGRQVEQATGGGAPAVRGALEQLGVTDAAALMTRLPGQISGGQAQRVLLAIARLRRPRLVFADEPSASLDGGNYDELVAQLRALLQDDCAVLLATHDQRLLRDLDAQVYAAAAGCFEPRAVVSESWPRHPVAPGVEAAPILRAHGLRVGFGDRQVLAGIDFAIARGEIVAVIGESGAGKTTLVRALAGHLPPTAGAIERPARAGAVQLCPQDALASLTPGRSLQSLLAEAHDPQFDVAAMCADLQLDAAVLQRAAGAMSGGERRRSMLMRALAVHPEVVLLDEPTAALDRRSAVAVLESLLALQQSRNLAIVLVTHDHELARSVAHRVVRVADGEVTPC